MADKYTVEEIVSFINGSMTKAESANFEKSLAEDAVLAKEVDEQRKLARIVQIATIKNKLEDIHESFAAEDQIVSGAKQGLSITWRVLSLAAILTGVILFLIFYKSGSAVNEKIFAVYFQDDTGTPSLMGSTASAFDEGMVYYKCGDYPKADSKFSALLNGRKASDTIRFYDALCQVHLKDNEKALQLLQSISQNSQTEFGIKVLWYSALIYIRQDNLKKAEELLTVVQKSKDPNYSLRAGKALNDLKNGEAK